MGEKASGFTEAQREAVTWGRGPLLVLAGPGSGKTFVITERVRYLVEQEKAKPGEILVVTFSRAAAREMESRYRSFGVRASGRVTFGTFHSFFFSLLRTAYGYSAEQVAGDEERASIVMSEIRRVGIEGEDMKTLSRNLLSEIALVKEERVALEHYYAKSCGAGQFRDLFAGYERALGQLKKIDYEDMLLMTYELLKGRPDILGAVRSRFKWILVDEFQDINRLQYEVVKLLAAPENNLTIVGDDDQSIYRFRGAKPEIMLGFKKDLPGAGMVLLDRNFRSTPEIVGAAGRLIRHNRERFPKEITAVRPSGLPVRTVVFPEAGDEAEWLVKELRDLAAGGMQWSDMAVLYRTNLQPRLLAAKLLQYNLPFRMQEQLPDLMDHWITRDILAYLRLAEGIPEPGDLARIMNRPNRYIRRDALREKGESLQGIRSYYRGLKQFWMMDRINELESELKILGRLNVEDAVARLREETGYDEFLKSWAEERDMDPEELLEILNEVAETCRAPGGEPFRTAAEWQRHMIDFREELKKKRAAESRQEGEQEDRNQIRLMTFHASKGLEFPAVYLIDVNDGIVPHRKASNREETEEERRMFYVAMTRAKDRLTVCTLKNRFRRKAEESPFIKEFENRA